MKKELLAGFFAVSIAAPVFAQSAHAPTETAVAQTEQIEVPADAPQGSSGPTAMGVGSGVAAVVVVFGVMALGAAFAMGG